mmetsp:Transcript_40139/g.72693  ORF Transcript_40139/g.72693 Transcript_40139/m.72693 type:complete len:607 (+) Transcript_40139:109-1929(+)
MTAFQEMMSLPFPLDDRTLHQADEASKRFVNGPWRCGMPLAAGSTGPVAAAAAAQPSCPDSEASSQAKPLWSSMSEEPDGTNTEATAKAVMGGKKEVEADAPRSAEAMPSASGGNGSNGSVAAAPGPASHKEEPKSEASKDASAEDLKASEKTPAPAATPAAVTSSPAASPSSSGPEKVVPAPNTAFAVRRTWANIVQKEDLEATAASSSRASASSRDDGKVRKDTVVDFLLHLAKKDKAAGEAPEELPEELKKFEQMLEGGMQNASRAKYVRRGMRNDANNCYVNVVVQSLLPCSSLMQLLSHCATNDPDRPFYTGMVRLCREFHSRKETSSISEPCNVLAMQQVSSIISRWQSIGAQQDAGEFLFYMLNGMHEECKWKGANSGEKPTEGNDSEGDDWAEVGKCNRKVDVRSAGVHEDSPVVRIFGGLLRSSVRSKNAKADSVSLEPFNHLILDISSQEVDSVRAALEAYCGAEAVNEGLAIKRLQFQVMPKVLILNLKRFSYNKDSGRPEKIKKPVRYDETLRLAKEWLVDDMDPVDYQLTAVICHHGDSVNGGHYNAAVRYNSEWFMYDDSLVRQMEIREVMNQHFTAYLLVYLCNEKVEIRP